MDASKSLVWKDAKQLLLERNHEIEDARRQYERACKRRKQYWKNYVPGVRVSATINERLTSLDAISLKNVNIVAFLNLRIPNPVTFTGEQYALNLVEYRAERSYELIKRRKVVELYRKFLRYEGLLKRLEMESPKNKSDTDSLSIFGQIHRQRIEKESRERTLDAIRMLELQLRSDLNTVDSRWHPVASSLPKLNYKRRVNHLRNDPAYGRLALQTIAADLEGTRLRYKQVKLSQWPSLSVNASSPRVYSSSDNADFDVDEIALFGGVTKSFDILNRAGDELEVSKGDYVKAIERAKVRIQRDVLTLEQAILQYNRDLKRLESLKKARAELVTFMKSGLSSETLLDTIKRVDDIDKGVKQINRSLIHKELEFWIWDEENW